MQYIGAPIMFCLITSAIAFELAGAILLLEYLVAVELAREYCVAVELAGAVLLLEYLEIQVG